MKLDAFLQEIHTAPGLLRAVLSGIVVSGTTATFCLRTDVTYSDEDKSHAAAVAQKYAPQGFRADVRIEKHVPDAAEVRGAIASFLKTHFPAAAAFLTPGDIEAVCDRTGGRFFLDVGASERPRFASGEILDSLSAELQRLYCGTWFGNVRVVARRQAEIEREELPPQEEAPAPRFFPVTGYVPIDGAKPKNAVYIADLTGEAQGVTICGQLSHIQEKQTARGKPFFSLVLADGSGVLRANYFSKKATLDKVRALKAGDMLCLTGDNETFNGGLSFRVKAIDRGAPEEGYVFEKRPSRPVPAAYKKVFPEPAFDYRQGMLFGEEPLPEALTRGEFVVFDLETTGLNNSPATGAMDHIIEVGAVRIRGGSICEKFSTFVACPVRLSQEIVSITGIEDEMLVGAPEVGDVMADFFKFCDGCALVGHNVQFDYKFIRYYGEKEGYLFENKTYDTCTLAQELLRLSNYKLNTVADHYGFTFRHHRAYDDAFVTAKIFIELIKEKKCLPDA